MADKSITLKILATGDQAIRAVRQVTGDIDKNLKQSEISLTSYGRAWQRAQSVARVGALAMAAGFTAAAGALSMAVNSAIDEADRFNELSKQLGIGTEKLSAYAYAAKLSATDLETLNPALQKLTRNMAAAMDGSSRQAQLFKAIGVSAVDASGHMRSLDAVVEDVAEVFKTLPDGPQKTALALELLGKQGAGAIEFFNNGRDGLRELTDEAAAFGLIVSKETATAAAEFNDRLDQLTFVGKGFAMQLAQEALPHLNKFTDYMLDVVRDGTAARETVDTIATGVRSLGKAMSFTVGMMGSLIEDLNSMGDWLAQQGPKLMTLAEAMSPTVASVANTLRISADFGAFDEQPARRTTHALRNAPVGVELVQDLVPLLRDAGLRVKELDAAHEAAVQSSISMSLAFDEEAASTQRVTTDLEEWLAKRQAAMRAEMQAREELRAKNKAMQEAEDKQKAYLSFVERAAREEQEWYEAQRKAREELQDRFRQQEQDLQQEIALLGMSTALRERAVISLQAESMARDETGRVIEAQKAKYEELLTKLADAQRMADVAREYENIWLDATDSIGDALTTALFDGADAGADAIKDVMENLARDLVRFWLQQKIVIPLQQQLVGGVGGAGGGLNLSSGIGGIASSAVMGYGIGGNAGAIGGLLGRGFASTGFGAGLLGSGLSALGVGGAALGSMVPVVGTIIGGLLGRALGGLFGGDGDPRFRIADRENDFRTSSRLDDVIGVARDNMEPGSATALGNAIKDFDNAIADFLSGDELARVRDALDNWTLDVSGSAATAENVLGQRFGAILATFDQDVQAYVNAADTLEERTQRLAEALSWDDQIDALLGGFRRENQLASMSEIERQTFLVNEQFDALAEQMRTMHATEAQLAELEGFRTQALERALTAQSAGIDAAGDLADAEADLIAARSEAMASLEQMMFGIRRQNAGLSEFAQAMLDAGDWRADAIRQATEHAQAAGLAAAREGDLAQIELRAAQMRAQAIAIAESGLRDSLVNAGYIDAPDTLESLNARIAELQSGAVDASSAFSSAADAMGQATDTMREQIALLLGDLSPFNDNRKLEIARQGLQAGNVSQEQFLQIARRLYGSTDRYRDEFEFAQQFAGRANNVGGGGGGFSGGSTARISSSGGDGRTLEQLEAARDALLAANRVTNAQDIARRLAELDAVDERSAADIAQAMGFDMNRLAADLSMNGEQLRDYLDTLAAQFSENQIMLGADAITAAIAMSTEAIVAAITGGEAIQVKPGPGESFKPGGGKSLYLPPSVATASRGESEAGELVKIMGRVEALLADIALSGGSTAESGAAAHAALKDVAAELRGVRRVGEDSKAPQRMMP